MREICRWFGSNNFLSIDDSRQVEATDVARCHATYRGIFWYLP